jgi:hypothetical protein
VCITRRDARVPVRRRFAAFVVGLRRRNRLVVGCLPSCEKSYKSCKNNLENFGTTSLKSKTCYQFQILHGLKLIFAMKFTDRLGIGFFVVWGVSVKFSVIYQV